MTIAENVLDLIGDTPLVRINKLNKTKVELYAKIEFPNPGGSVKDRIAKCMIERAETVGLLKKGMTILEPTSGNTGIGLAIVGAIRGYNVKLVMPESMSIERRKVLKAYGAELILTPAEEGMIGAIEKANAMLAKDPKKYFMPNQFASMCNPRAHFNYTGKEILKDVPDIDVFVAGMGTGGTLHGVGKRLKRANPKVKIVGVEPKSGSHIQGLRNMGEGFIPEIFNPGKLDEIIKVGDKEAFDTAKALARKEGLLVGISSGAAMYGALLKAKQMKKGKIVVLLPDTGMRYLSTGLFDED